MSDFADYRTELKNYQKDYPMQEVQLKDGVFSYILAGPDDAPHTLVFLNGGMNSHEMWMRYVKDLSKDYQVLSFDYPEMYETDQALLAVMHELFERLSFSRVILIGASMGGILAQLYAHVYPEDTEGLCLMSTAGLTQATMKKYGKLLGLLGIEEAIMKILPYRWIQKSERKSCDDYVAEADEEARAYFHDMFDEIFDGYSREKDLHVVKIMKDFRHQKVCSKKDFEFLAGKVLLLLPENDSAFPKAVQKELIEEMTDPVVIPGIRGGHLTTMLNDQEFIGYIREFLNGRF